MAKLVKRCALTKINSVTVGTERPRPRMRNISSSPKYAAGGWIIQCPMVRAPQRGNIVKREDIVSYPVNGQDSNPGSELTFVRAQRFTDFAIKAIYALRTVTGCALMIQLLSGKRKLLLWQSW
jgi:hypothetical protein